MRTISDRKKTAAPMLRMLPDTYYVWVAGSCDYSHEDRCSGGAYISVKDREKTEKYAVNDAHTTEFRLTSSL